jgi:hypothetical protein
MNRSIFRDQLIDLRGAIYNPGQQVEVNENGVWRPAQIQNLESYTVKNFYTRVNTNIPPNQVFLERGDPNANGENTNLIPGRQILFQGPDPGTRIPGIIVSKNYIVQIDGRTENVPNTRLRRASGQPQPQPQPGQQQPQPGQPPGGPPPTSIYHIGQQVEVNVNDEWRPGQIQGEGNYTVMATATEEISTIERRDVRPEGGYLGLVLNNRRFVDFPGSRIEFLGRGRWLPGTIVSRNYIVQIDGRTETVPTTRLREATVQPQAAVRLGNEEFLRQMREIAANPNVPPRPAAPQGPRAGVAFEVHNAFDDFKAKKWDKFMEIINRTTGTNTNFRNRNAPLQPLIDYVNTSESFNENKASLTPEDKAEMIRKKSDIIQKINRIFTQIQGYGNYNSNIDNITNCIQYVLMQPPEFIDAYINTFVVDCFKAYNSSTREESCVKGMYERIYLAFRDTVSTLCLDQIQGISAAASLCKPEYIEIYDCFYETIPQELLNDFSKEWYAERGDETLGSLSEEARIEDFVSFVRGRMNDATRFAKAEASIRRYANKEINILFGGRRNRSRRNKKTNKKRSVRKNSRSKRSVIKTNKKSKKPKKRSVKKY